MLPLDPDKESVDFKDVTTRKNAMTKKTVGRPRRLRTITRGFVSSAGLLRASRVSCDVLAMLQSKIEMFQ